MQCDLRPWRSITLAAGFVVVALGCQSRQSTESMMLELLAAARPELERVGASISDAAATIVNEALSKSAELAQQQQQAEQVADVAERRQNRLEAQIDDVEGRLRTFADTTTATISKIDLSVGRQLVAFENTTKSYESRLSRVEQSLIELPTRKELERTEGALSETAVTMKADLTRRHDELKFQHRNDMQGITEEKRAANNFLLAVVGAIVGIVGVTFAGLSTLRAHRMTAAREAEQRAAVTEDAARSAASQIAELKTDRTAIDRLGSLIGDLQRRVEGIKSPTGPDATH